MVENYPQDAEMDSNQLQSKSNYASEDRFFWAICNLLNELFDLYATL